VGWYNYMVCHNFMDVKITFLNKILVNKKYDIQIMSICVSIYILTFI